MARRVAVCMSVMLAMTALAVALASPADAESGGAVPTYSHASAAVVVRYVEIPGELGEGAGGPTLTVYGDGRAVAQYPAYMRRAGAHEATLARGEVDALVTSLAAKGVVGFDAPAVAGQMHAADAARAAALSTGDVPGTVLVAVTDPSTIVIELGVEAPEAGSGAALGQTTNRAVWSGLDADVARHPSVTALTDLVAAREELRGLMGRVHGAAQ